MPSDTENPRLSEARDRRRQMLLTAFGSKIVAALDYPHVTVILFNPDVKLSLVKANHCRMDSAFFLRS